MNRLILLAVLLLLSLLSAGESRSALGDENPTPEAAPGDEGPAQGVTKAESDAAEAEAQSVGKRVHALCKQGKYREALTGARTALALREKAHGSDHPYVASSLTVLAFLFQQLLEDEKAQRFFERALRIYEEAFGPDNRPVAMTLDSLARLHVRRGEPRKALLLATRLVEMRQKSLGPDHPELASGLGALGSALYELGRYGEALPLFRRALGILEKVRGPQHPDVASALNSLGTALHALGEYEEALPVYQRAGRIWENALGPRHQHVSTALLNSAGTLDALGACETARSLLRRAVSISEEALGREHPQVATGLNNLGTLLQKLGAYDEARPLFDRAIEIWEAALGRDHPTVAMGINNKAYLLERTGAYKEAQPLLERALEIQEKALGSDHPDVAICLTNLSAVLRALGSVAEARNRMKRALAIFESAHGPDHPRVGLVLSNLASVQDDENEAVRLRLRALEIWESALGPNHASVALALNNLALCYDAKKMHGRAGPLWARSLDIIELQVRRHVAGLQASERFALNRLLRVIFTNALRSAPHLGRSGMAEVLRFKGLLARVANAERKLGRAGGSNVTSRVRALHASERRLATLANSPPSFLDKEARIKWQEAYARAASERESLGTALARDFAPLRQGLERLDLKLPDIKAAMGKQAVLIDYTRSGDIYVALIVPHIGNVQRVDLGDAAEIDTAAMAFAQQAADPDNAAWKRAGAALWELILEPIEERIGRDVTTLHICPDAALAVVPFGALPSPEGGDLLGEKYVISTISMAQELVPWKDAPTPGKGALLLGGVDYGRASATTVTSKPNPTRDRAPRGRTYAYLSGTKTEVLAIRPHMGAGAATVLGADATEAVVRAASKGKRVLHLATHGFVREDLMRGLLRREEERRWLGAAMERQLAAGHDPMNLSGLAMAGANTRKGGGDDDGILTALEASHLDLDGVALVVLSACQTALGTPESGEGVIGLVRGFQMAGATQVIGSLWKVDDLATQALMVEFYRLWTLKDAKRGIGAAAALKRAQAFVRSQPKWRHPYYWAAWLVWGVD